MHPDNRPLSPWLHWEVMATFSFMLAYAAGVYFHAATASLSDAYQPGLDSLKRYVQPGIALWVLPLIAYGWKSVHLTKVAQRCALRAGWLGLLRYAVCLLFSPPIHSGHVLGRSCRSHARQHRSAVAFQPLVFRPLYGLYHGQRHIRSDGVGAEHPDQPNAQAAPIRHTQRLNA